MDSIQEVIEELATRLQRSVAVDDADLRLQASSRHFADADPARLDALVGRRVEGAVRDHVFAAGVRHWRTMQRLPANPSIGAAKVRVAFPLWSRYELLGFMWIIEDGPLTEEEIELCEDTAQKVLELMDRKVRAEAEGAREVESLTLALLSPDERERLTAVEDLTDFGLMGGATQFTALVATVSDVWIPDLDDKPTVLIRRAFGYVTKAGTPGLTISGVTDTDSVIIFGHRSPMNRATVTDIVHRLTRELERLDREFASRVYVGIGGPQSPLSRVATSFDQAVQAAHFAQRVDKRFAIWGEDPLEALLGAVLVPSVDSRLVPPVLRELDQAVPPGALELIEVYLDLAGNVAKTAEKMNLHRTSVYYRLSKFQERTGMDLEDGTTRLLLHLWLKARRRLREHPIAALEAIP